MKYKVFFDREIPVDDEEIPEDFSFEMENRDDAFDYINDTINDFSIDFPIMDVTENGKSCYDEFNMFIEKLICEAIGEAADEVNEANHFAPEK